MTDISPHITRPPFNQKARSYLQPKGVAASESVTNIHTLAAAGLTADCCSRAPRQ